MFTNESKTTTILTTGSGILSNYWYIMEMVGSGMIGVESLTFTKE